jgi:hypothetical protein
MVSYDFLYKQTIISLNTINQSVFVMVKCCVCVFFIGGGGGVRLSD